MKLQLHKPRVQLVGSVASWSIHSPISAKYPAEPASVSTELVGVAAVSSKPVWMAGSRGLDAFRDDGPVLHWDGAIIKNVSPLPPPPKGDGAELLGIAALPSGQVWLAGDAGRVESWILFTDQGQ